jgi:hypothetical protein
MKRIPISERIASKMAAEHKELKGVVEKSVTVFYNEHNQPVFEVVREVKPLHSLQEWVSYFGYVSEYKAES